MPLNPAIVRTLFLTELRMLARDRRTIIMAILLPILVTPVMLFATSGMQRVRERTLDRTVYRYALTGSEAAAVQAFITAMHERRADAESSASDDLATEPAVAPKSDDDRFRHEAIEVTDPAAALAQQRIHFYLDAVSAEEARARRTPGAVEEPPPEQPHEALPDAPHPTDQPTPDASATPPDDVRDAADEAFEPPDDWREPLVAGAPVIQLVYRADRDDSQSGMRRMRAALSEYRRAAREGLLATAGFPVAGEAVATIEDENLATAGEVAGLAFGRLVTLIALMFIMSGCAVAATDSIAGEKERGTLETLLTTAATRLEIVIAKHLTVLAVAIVIALVQAANLIIYVGFELIPVPQNFAAALPPGVTLLLLVLFLPLTALTASVLLLTSGYARTYKEAQLYFTPVLFVGAVLAFAAFLPGVPLRSAIVMLPVANIAVAAREILTGTFDWPLLAVAWLVTAGVAAGATRLSVHFLGTEKLITAGESDAVDRAGGPALFGRVVLRWFLVLWAALLIVSNYEANADVRVQVLINVVVLFFGASLLMLRRYRLDPRAALALRAPRPAVWFAVLVAVPAAIFAGTGVMQLSELLFPVAPELLEEIARSFRFEELPAWQLVIFVGLLPGVFEEITFRGLLLHGLHRRLHPVLLVIVVGLIFGVFHVTLPRIIPTAYLGLLFTAVVLLTGSIYPAMLWHAANNTVMILHGEDLLALAASHPLYSAVGTIVLALCFAVIWWNRTPYPNLRPWRKRRAGS